MCRAEPKAVTAYLKIKLLPFGFVEQYCDLFFKP